ncbi:MAG: type II toxin-antitoxin system RelE/ParE family toxin [Stenomitos rutilans HA7619-LM2]|nr:type II toxin-antitoxin system RelE/ParE family toxin [Stenomitos rutilans HA7619-LM2]
MALIRNLAVSSRITPIDEWFNSLKSEKTQTLIDKAIDKVSRGLLTDNNSEPLGEGVSEFKVDSGPGYRIYYGQKGLTVVLLHGGVKKTQERDIRKAKAYWADYEERENANQ